MENVVMVIRTIVRSPRDVKFGVDGSNGSEDVKYAIGFVSGHAQVDYQRSGSVNRKNDEAFAFPTPRFVIL
jgi:hypothetical protein